MEFKYCMCVWMELGLNHMILFSLRVGRENAKTRQDIVLSGHFIKDEHCTFSSTTSPQGEGDGCLRPTEKICKCFLLTSFDIF